MRLYTFWFELNRNLFRNGNFKNLEAVFLVWFKQARHPICRPLITTTFSKAYVFAEQMNGVRWGEINRKKYILQQINVIICITLERFDKQNGIAFKNIYGESREVLQKLPLSYLESTPPAIYSANTLCCRPDNTFNRRQTVF